MNGTNESTAVSVIVPTFNRTGLLRQTLECLRRQTLRECEFLIVDDGSGPYTIDLLEQTCLEDGRFRIIWKPRELPRGCQSSKNHALSEIKGRYVVFLDSDDFLAPDCLRRRALFLDEHPDVDIAVGQQAVLQESSGEVRWVNSETLDDNDLDRFLNLTHPLDIPWVNGAVAIRAPVLKRQGISYRPEFRWEDAAFHIECLSAGLRAAWMPRSGFPDSFYRIHGRSMGSDLWTKDGIENCATMLLWIRSLLENRGLLCADRLSIIRRNYFHLAILRAIDARMKKLARELIFQGAPLFSSEEIMLFVRFSELRSLTSWSSRLTWYVNQRVRRQFPAFFPNVAESWGSMPCNQVPDLGSVCRITPCYRPASETILEE